MYLKGSLLARGAHQTSCAQDGFLDIGRLKLHHARASHVCQPNPDPPPTVVLHEGPVRRAQGEVRISVGLRGCSVPLPRADMAGSSTVNKEELLLPLRLLRRRRDGANQVGPIHRVGPILIVDVLKGDRLISSPKSAAGASAAGAARLVCAVRKLWRLAQLARPLLGVSSLRPKSSATPPAGAPG
jgi:hypothetical protein